MTKITGTDKHRNLSAVYNVTVKANTLLRKEIWISNIDYRCVGVTAEAEATDA